MFVLENFFPLILSTTTIFGGPVTSDYFYIQRNLYRYTVSILLIVLSDTIISTYPHKLHTSYPILSILESIMDLKIVK